MDFIDWRKSPEKIQLSSAEPARSQAGRLRGKKFHDYIEEIIHEAQQRGDFDNLAGTGKPLNLDDDPYAGDKALGYRLLKNNDCLPSELELAREIRTERERIEAKVAKIIHRGETLRARRVPPFPSEKRAFNTTVEKVAAEYEQTLLELNRKVLTLNLTVPATMHQPFIEVESLLQNFRDACPLFEDKPGNSDAVSSIFRGV
jgi:DnaJ homolog subfamily C member 28